jgi:hypothetical protein
VVDTDVSWLELRLTWCTQEEKQGFLAVHKEDSIGRETLGLVTNVTEGHM